MNGPKPLDEYRRNLLLSVDEFAAKLDVTIRTLYRIREGRDVHLPTMRKITEALGVPPGEIKEFAAQLTRMDTKSKEATGGE